MFQATSRVERAVFACLGVVATAIAFSQIATAFLPADPHVGVQRATALLDRADQIRVQAAGEDRLVRTVSVITLIH
jgi:hypothetical protein